jgi:Asp/Glu/hydantoin racemase
MNIPPYRSVNYTPTEGHFLVREIADNMRKKGQLEGVEFDIDDGYPIEHAGENRDEEFLANITTGFLKRVKEISEMGKYDAIVASGSLDPGFFAGRSICKIPIASSIHSAIHVASLIGDRFTIIELSDAMALIIRHYVQLYGLSHKLASVRTIASSSTYVMGFIRKYKKEDRINVPEVKKLLDDIAVQCIAAIEKDMADSLIIGCPALQPFEDEIRQRLDESGYNEIQLICELPAAVEMAKAMVNMKLTQAPRAYPTDHLKVKPEFR